ncbi:20133_t:CDS:2 [Racocetra fulgida]|uniref:20133_t:CDS:1 n=1 Tax=Racocetra fulgida TaxID=60492 RepID=A0A9N9AH43_9GLOM|nr:20133_t:CDS:2 [Racocetra fulgida]
MNKNIFSKIFGDNEEEKYFSFKIDDNISINKKFKLDVKLEDVRKELAEYRDEWKAEKLLFKYDGSWILHEDEPNYTINKLCKPNKYICVENLLKEINVYLDNKDGKMLLPFLDPKDKLKDIRKIFTENSEHEEIVNGFKFRWQNGTIVKECQEDVRKLEEILVNGNELYISTSQKGKVIIYSSHSKTSSQPLIYDLDKGKSLSEIREELESTWKEQTQLYMCSDCYFLDQKKARIVRCNENNLKLEDILSIENGDDVLNIYREHEHDLIKLTNKCGYGFIMKDGSVERAKYRAFTIEETPECHSFEDKCEEDLFECKNEFQELYKRNFITFGTTSILPWASIFMKASYSSSYKKPENYKTIKYSYIKLRRMSVNISRSKISVAGEFVDDVKKALSKGNQAEKVKNLKNIAEKYGYFYASSVNFGGVIVQQIEDTKYSKSVKSFHIKSQLAGTTLETGTSTAMESRSIKSRYVIKGGDKSCNLSGKQLEDIPNIKECQIFTTILKKKKDRHIFSSCVAYDTPENPIIIVSRVPNKKKKLAKKSNPNCIIIQIGWMIVGYPTDTFDFELSNQIIIESEKRELNDQYIVDNISHMTNLNLGKFSLSTCVMDNVENSLQEETTSKSRTLYLKTDGINPNEKPIFANHSFDKDCHDDECHGIINVSPGHLHFKILNDYSSVKSKPEISYFSVFPEGLLYKNEV